VQTGLSKAIISIAALFSVLAGIMAFLITYEENQHHFLDKRQVRNTALRSAVVAFAVFLLLGFMLAALLPYVFQ
jgi:hypothetical protein